MERGAPPFPPAAPPQSVCVRFVAETHPHSAGQELQRGFQSLRKTAFSGRIICLPPKRVRIPPTRNCSVDSKACERLHSQAGSSACRRNAAPRRPGMRSADFQTLRGSRRYCNIFPAESKRCLPWNRGVFRGAGDRSLPGFIGRRPKRGFREIGASYRPKSHRNRDYDPLIR